MTVTGPMQARKKYVLLGLCACCWLVLFYWGGGVQLRVLQLLTRHRAEVVRPWPNWTDRAFLPCYAHLEELQTDRSWDDRVSPTTAPSLVGHLQGQPLPHGDVL